MRYSLLHPSYSPVCCPLLVSALLVFPIQSLITLFCLLSPPLLRSLLSCHISLPFFPFSLVSFTFTYSSVPLHLFFSIFISSPVFTSYPTILVIALCSTFPTSCLPPCATAITLTPLLFFLFSLHLLVIFPLLSLASSQLLSGLLKRPLFFSIPISFPLSFLCSLEISLSTSSCILFYPTLALHIPSPSFDLLYDVTWPFSSPSLSMCLAYSLLQFILILTPVLNFSNSSSQQLFACY